MAGYLPPVVTTLKGDIDPLLKALAKAKAAIKALDGTTITIKVNFDFNGNQFAAGMGAAQAAASRGVRVPVRFDYGDQRAITTGPFVVPPGGFGGGPYALGGGRQPLALTAAPGNPDYFTVPGNGGGGGPSLFDRIMYGAGAGGGYTNFLNGGRGFNAPIRLPWFGNVNQNLFHAGLTGAAALGMGAVGAGVFAGSMGAVYGSTAAQMYRQGAGLFQAQQAMIPPGVPDYALAKAFGLNNAGPGSPLAVASRLGAGQVYSAYGGIAALFNKGGPLAPLIAQYGLQGGQGVTNAIARMDLRATANPNSLAKFFAATTGDASNIGAGFANLGAFAGHTLSHMPGELEWLTQGFRLGTGGLNDLWKVPGLKSVLGGAAFTGFFAHAMSLAAHGLNRVPGIGRLLGMSGVSDSSASRAFAALTGTKGLNLIGGWEEGSLMSRMSQLPIIGGAFSTAGLGIGLPVLAMLGAYRYQNPTSSAIKAQLAGLGYGQLGMPGAPVSSGAFGSSYFGTIGRFAQGANSAGNGRSFWGNLLNGNSYFGDYLHSTMGQILDPAMWFMAQKTLSPAQQNAQALQEAMPGIMSYGGGINAVARAMHVSTAEAANMMGMAGVRMQNGKIVGGNATAIRLVRSFWNANGIFNGQRGEIGANMAIGNIVGDSAWQQASKINANWDQFFGAMTGGGIGLGNLWSVLARVSPSAARNLAAPIGLVPTSQAISSAGEPLMDFFRQAQSVGAIGGKSLQNSFLQVAASMGPLAGKSKSAQAELVALANQSGLDVKSFGQLMQMTGGSGKAMSNLSNSIAQTTINMAKVPAISQSVMSKVTSDVAGAAAAIIAKNKDARTSFDNLTNSIVKYGANSPQALGAAQKFEAIMEKSKMPMQEIVTLLEQMGIYLDKLPSSKTITVTVVGKVAGNPNALAIAGYNAQGQLSSQTTATAGPNGYMRRGHAGGTPSAPPGWAWVGEQGPELMFFAGGERVMNHQMSLNAASGGEHHHHLYIDGKEIQNVVKRQTYQYNVNNGNRDAQGRVRGNFRPRG